jgi:hypothetical protein
MAFLRYRSSSGNFKNAFFRGQNIEDEHHIAKRSGEGVGVTKSIRQYHFSGACPKCTTLSRTQQLEVARWID